MRRPLRRPADPERVLLDVPGMPPLAASVTRAVPGAAELRLTDATARVLHRRPALVRPAGGADAEPLDVLLVGVQDGRGRLREDVVQAVWVGVAPQRRSFVRVPAFRPVTVVCEEPGLARPRVLRAVTRDLGAGGALLGGTAARELREGDRLALTLDLGEAEDALRARARVVRADGEAVAAVALEALRDPERERLARWVRARELDALVRLAR
jgi:hypothetical protein